MRRLFAFRKPRFKDHDLVPVTVAYGEKELRELLRARKARWDAERNYGTCGTD